jgi:bacteriocin-like protein
MDTMSETNQVTSRDNRTLSATELSDTELQAVVGGEGLVIQVGITGNITLVDNAPKPQPCTNNCW